MYVAVSGRDRIVSNCIRCRFCFRTTRRMSNEAWPAALKVHGTRSLFLSLTNRREICIPADVQHPDTSLCLALCLQPSSTSFLFPRRIPSLHFDSFFLSLSLWRVFPRFRDLANNLRDPSSGNLEINNFTSSLFSLTFP